MDNPLAVRGRVCEKVHQGIFYGPLERVSGLIALANPRRIKAAHRRRRKCASGPSVQRYYDPTLGRFLSVDPVTANPNTGGNFNRYFYANNNPYKFNDPDGRIAETPWDAFNVGLDVVSLVGNLAAGNYAGAAVDAGGLIVDAAATLIPGVPGGAGTAIKLARAAQLAENVKQGAKAENAVAKKLGDQVAGKRVTLESSTGKRSVADIVTKDKGVTEVKSGNSPLSPGQKAVKADIDAGRSVTPRGQNADKAGLTPGQPVQMKCYQVDRC